MKMLSGRMHWLAMGLALVVSAQGFTTKTLLGQSPYGIPTGPQGMGAPSMMGMPNGQFPDAPMSMAFKGPPPMEVAYASHAGRCDGSGCDTAGCGCGGGGAMGFCGGDHCGGVCGGMCGGSGGLMNRLGCGACGGAGCNACGGGLGGGLGGDGLGSHGCLLGRGLFGGRLAGLLGPLAPYSESGTGAQRYFDFYGGTIGLKRTSNVGGFQSYSRDVNLNFVPVTQVSVDSANINSVLNTSDLDLDEMRFGLELIASLQVGVGSNVEARYFGLNSWEDNATLSVVGSGTPTLDSVFSQFGTVPAGGYDDTDNSFIHSIDYESAMHSGEVNFRRRFVAPVSWVQGSWLMGIRYFDLDERFGFHATGSQNNTFAADQLRFFDYNTSTRNEMTGFQVGSDLWVNVIPGLQVGVESKSGIFGNHAEVESIAVSNSIPGAREFLQTGETAYLAELTASAVYRLSYSWSVKTSYNLLYVDNVALAPENMNVRGFGSSAGAVAGTFDAATREPFINTDGEAVYQGWSIGGEFLF
ncbi:BBP7 family outer membrane beta-barrel protein [Aureliella helgolandensis]|uniref:Uncharacterized protein n=1 Tax=Aureliella helgolandensis TaxID=2527968 RepID=A0A518G7Z9_9BACT|nr:BBP7 family outer membrane beta-barrel protein [Aureliella helgolandensis]QDV24714.1 hypothetical protein Q31a_30350 [Aureliella helgolandensis]